MHFLVLSDIHGDTVHLEKLDAEFAKADCVLFAGDFTNEGNSAEGIQILERLIEKHNALFAVVGNCDAPSFLEELEKRDVSVQKTLTYRDGLVFAGCGGALKFTGVTPNERTEDDLMSDLQIVRDRRDEWDGTEDAAAGEKSAAWNNLILVVHYPPHNTKLDIITAGIHVGSPAFRKLLEEYQPLVSVSGHIHESPAIDTIGNTTLINPGSLAEGRYAVLEVQKQNGEWKVIKAELKEL